MKKSVLFLQWALDLTHSSTVPYSVVWVLEPLLDFLIIPGIRMHINCVWRGGGVYMQLDSEHIREYYGACSDFPLILSFCTHSNFHGLYTIICPPPKIFIIRHKALSFVCEQLSWSWDRVTPSEDFRGHGDDLYGRIPGKALSLKCCKPKGQSSTLAGNPYKPRLTLNKPRKWNASSKRALRLPPRDKSGGHTSTHLSITSTSPKLCDRYAPEPEPLPHQFCTVNWRKERF